MFRLFVIAGAGIFTLLGAIHAIYTFQDLSRPRWFTPPDAELQRAMQQSAVALHPKINLWRAWLGFNFSHSLGLVVFGGAFLYVSVFHPALFSQSPLVQGCSILVSAIYLILSLKFWFHKPAIYAGIAMGCFVLATALSYV